MAFHGYWQGNRYLVEGDKEYAEAYFKLWDSFKYNLSQIQGFEFDLRDMLESYAILSKQAIALGRSDLLDETLTRVKRVNAIKEDWTKIDKIVSAYFNVWPNYYIPEQMEGHTLWRPTYSAYMQTHAGILFGTPHDALEYVSVYWPQLKERFLNEYYALRQLEKKFTPAEIIAVPEPHIPLPGERIADVTAIHPEPSGLLEQVKLAGFPIWSIFLLAGTGIFMLFGKEK